MIYIQDFESSLRFASSLGPLTLPVRADLCESIVGGSIPAKRPILYLCLVGVRVFMAYGNSRFSHLGTLDLGKLGSRKLGKPSM